MTDMSTKIQHVMIELTTLRGVYFRERCLRLILKACLHIIENDRKRIFTIVRDHMETQVFHRTTGRFRAQSKAFEKLEQSLAIRFEHMENFSIARSNHNVSLLSRATAS